MSPSHKPVACHGNVQFSDLFGHVLLLYVACSVLSARQELAERVDYVVFLRLSKARREASRILRFEQTMRGRARPLRSLAWSLGSAQASIESEHSRFPVLTACHVHKAFSIQELTTSSRD